MKPFLLLVFFAALNMSVVAQNKVPLLERTLTLSVENERVGDVLRKISQEAGFSFSYKSNLINDQDRVTLNLKSKTVREALDLLFKGSVQYKERGKHIILTKSTASSSANDSKLISGYVIDEATGQRLKNVSVYDPETFSSSVTNAYGYFEIKIDRPSADAIKLAISKNTYTDTVVVVNSGTPRLLNIPIKFNKDKFSMVVDSVGVKIKRFWIATKHATQQAVNMENISDTLRRRVQFSVIPFVGTNGKLSGNTVNDYSLNLLGGYALGVKKLEVGGLFNAVGGHNEGVQIAGLANGVAGKNKGLQFAGLTNVVIDSSTGPQFAGLVNVNFTNTKTFAGAGLINMTMGNASGVSIAGLSNVTLGAQQGVYLAGLFNFSLAPSGPAQLAGLFNFSGGSVAGVQVAGMFNIALKDVTGAQVSGSVNVVPGTLKGTQVGVVNFAKYVNGAQVGVLNVSKEVKGIPVGVLSIVGKGYHKIEIAADELFYTNIAFRTGVRQFYNIITAGARPSTFEKDQTLWSFGYGLGTAPQLSKKLFLNVDVTSNQLVNGNKVESVNLLNKLFVGVDYQFAKHLSITAGATLNAYMTDTTKESIALTFENFTPSFLYDETHSNKLNTKMWIGGKVGIRFL